MKKKLIALIVAGELLIFSGVVLGYYHPVAGSIFEIIGGLLNLWRADSTLHRTKPESAYSTTARSSSS